MPNFFQDLLQSIAIKDALIIVIVSMIAFGPKLIDYLAHRLSNRAERETMQTEADKQELALEIERDRQDLELERERDRHSRESSKQKMQLIELQLTEINTHNDNLMSLIDQLQKTNTALITDNRKLNARVSELETQLAKIRPYLQELHRRRRKQKTDAAEIKTLKQQLTAPQEAT